MRTMATYIHHSCPTTGIDTKSVKRSRSPTTIVLRRTSRSATTPAIGPRTIAGAMRRMKTPETARYWPTPSRASSAARAVVASRASQSPKLESEPAMKSLRNGRMASRLRRAGKDAEKPGCGAALRDMAPSVRGHRCELCASAVAVLWRFGGADVQTIGALTL
jgi:hypothetical protein